jgi:lysozyme
MKTNRGDFEEAAEEFMKWTKAAGRVLPGLVKRRKDEQRLYLS